MSHIIGDKLFRVEGDVLSKQSQHLLDKVRTAMENMDICSKCKLFGGEMSFFFGDIIVKIDWKNQKIKLEKSD